MSESNRPKPFLYLDRSSAIIFAIYTLLHILLSYFHEPWRDELQSLGIASISNSLAELFHNKAYEGHPSLWYLILYAATRITGALWLVKLIHLVISCTGIWVFLRFAPFKKYINYLVVFGYFFMFEYSIPFRLYSIEFTFTFIFCALMGKKHFLVSALVVLLLLQTNIYGFFIGGGLWFIYTWQHWEWRNSKMWLAQAIFILAVFLFLLSAVPPASSNFYPGWDLDLPSFITGASHAFNAFFPFPEIKFQFWNTNFSDPWLHNTQRLVYIKIAVLIFTVATCLFVLRNSAKAVMFFLLTFSATYLFFSVKYPGWLRHHGHVFVCFIIALWIKELFPSGKTTTGLVRPPLLNRVALLLEPAGNAFVLFLLTVHVAASAVAYFYDFRFPFSDSTAAADYISKEKPSYFLIGHTAQTTSGISILMHKKFYYPITGNQGTFFLFNSNSFRLTDDSLVSATIQKRKQFGPTLLVTDHIIEDKDLLLRGNLSLVKKFDPCIVADEQFYLYE